MPNNLLQTCEFFNNVNSVSINGLVYNRIMFEYDLEEIQDSLEDGDSDVVLSLYTEDNNQDNDIYFDAEELDNAVIISADRIQIKYEYDGIRLLDITKVD